MFFTVKTYPNGGAEIVLDGRRKVIYNTFKDGCGYQVKDVVYFNSNNEVSGVLTNDGLVVYGKRDLELDLIEIPKSSNELQSLLLKKKILDELEKDEHCHDEYVKSFIYGGVDPKLKMIDVVKKFFDLTDASIKTIKRLF